MDVDQIASLGFDVDIRNTLHIVHEYLDKLESELDRDNIDYVLQTLTNIKDMIVEQDDEELTLEYEIIEARALQKAENVTEAREKYEQIFANRTSWYTDMPYLPQGKVAIYNTTFEENGFSPLPEWTDPPELPTSDPELLDKYPLTFSAYSLFIFQFSTRRIISCI